MLTAGHQSSDKLAEVPRVAQSRSTLQGGNAAKVAGL